MPRATARDARATAPDTSSGVRCRRKPRGVSSYQRTSSSSGVGSRVQSAASQRRAARRSARSRAGRHRSPATLSRSGARSGAQLASARCQRGRMRVATPPASCQRRAPRCRAAGSRSIAGAAARTACSSVAHRLLQRRQRAGHVPAFGRTHRAPVPAVAARRCLRRRTARPAPATGAPRRARRPARPAGFRRSLPLDARGRRAAGGG